MKNLEKTIRKAFSCTALLNTLSSEDAREANHEISRLDNASAVKLLPLLMLKEMHGAGVENSCPNGDHLVYFLDGALLKREKDGSLTPRDGEASLVLRKLKYDDFKDYTKEQTHAITLWLKQVAVTKYGKLCPVDIASALTFWEARIK